MCSRNSLGNTTVATVFLISALTASQRQKKNAALGLAALQSALMSGSIEVPQLPKLHFFYFYFFK